MGLGNSEEMQLQGVKGIGQIQICALYGVSLLVMCVHHCTVLFKMYVSCTNVDSLHNQLCIHRHVCLYQAWLLSTVESADSIQQVGKHASFVAAHQIKIWNQLPITISSM